MKQTWEDGAVGGIFYRVVTLLVSLFVGWEMMSWSMPEAASFFQMIGNGVVGLGIAGLTYFLFHGGIGSFDNKIVDGLVNFAAYLAGFSGLVTRKLQTGKVQTYLAFVLFGVLVLYLWF